VRLRELRGTAAKKRPIASGPKINLADFYTTSKVYLTVFKNVFLLV